MWKMWLGNKLMRTVDETMCGVEPKIAEQMKLMMVGDTIYPTGYYNYQIIRIS